MQKNKSNKNIITSLRNRKTIDVGNNNIGNTDNEN